MKRDEPVANVAKVRRKAADGKQAPTLKNKIDGTLSREEPAFPPRTREPRGCLPTIAESPAQSRSCMYQGYDTGKRDTLLNRLADSRGSSRSNPARFWLS
jgi:hypothetical protein